MRRFLIPIALVLVVGFQPVSLANVAVKAGASCVSKGQVKISKATKFTCMKSGKKLVWQIVKVSKISPWELELNSKKLSEAAEQKFREWAATRENAEVRHSLYIQNGVEGSSKNLLVRLDNMTSKLFSGLFPEKSQTFIALDTSWLYSKANENGWGISANNPFSCNSVQLPYDYCLNQFNNLGFVVYGSSSFDNSNPGAGALLPHEYFHLVQGALTNSSSGLPLKTFDSASINKIPAWFLEGTADYVGFSIFALAYNSTYTEARNAMFTYSPQGYPVNSNAIADYEIRIGAQGDQTYIYPYHIGRVATEYIVASLGFKSILDILSDYRTTYNFSESFKKCTGISLDDFYVKFEKIRTKVGLPPVTWKLDGAVNKRI